MTSTIIASFFGAGRSPWAPGTAGSLVALLLGAAALHGPVWLLPALAVAATLAGLLAIPHAVPDREADPGWVVIDEVAGQWITLLGLAASPSIPGLLAAFLLFRALDIWKPGPIGWADRKPGAVGIMLDDVIAGVIAALLLLALRHTSLGATL